MNNSQIRGYRFAYELWACNHRIRDPRSGGTCGSGPALLCNAIFVTSGGYLQKSNSLLLNSRCGQHPGPKALLACDACRRGGCGRGGGAPSRLSKTFEFLYQFITIFQHSKMQLFISRCHHMWAIPCVHCNYHQTNQDGKIIKLNILPCTCIHMYFQPKYKLQITN